MIDWKDVTKELPDKNHTEIIVNFYDKITKITYRSIFWFYNVKNICFADYNKDEQRSGCTIFFKDDDFKAVRLGDNCKEYNLVMTHWAYINKPEED